MENLDLQEFVDECVRRGVVSTKLLSAISSETKLEQLILDHVTWAGDETTHVGNLRWAFISN